MLNDIMHREQLKVYLGFSKDIVFESWTDLRKKVEKYLTRNFIQKD